MSRSVTPESAAPKAAAALVLAFVLALSLVLAGGSRSDAATMTARNPGFENGLAGWTAAVSTTRLASSSRAHSGSGSLKVSTTKTAYTSVRSASRVTDGSAAGATYVWTAWMQGTRTGLRGSLRVREYAGGALVQTRASTVRLVGGRWQQLRLEMTRQRAGSRFEIRLGSPRQRTTDALRIDDVAVRPKTAAVPTPTPDPDSSADATGPTLSNGCATTARGVPLCGAYLGSAYGSNTVPTPMEDDMDRRLGVRRTYFTGSQVDSAVRTARNDLDAGRLPWISLKLPHSWTDMEDGRGDTWTRELADQLADLPGPVWLAFHHEPEGDGDIQTWRRMQERLAPIVREAAPNVAYTVVLTGWHQLYGDARYELDAIFPRGKVDVAGFDVYNAYGEVKDGVMNTKNTNLRASYFEPISAWAEQRGVAWGIAETGFTDEAAELYPHWVQQTYQALEDLDGVAFTYFNTTLNSIANWALTTTVKRASYREAAVGSPVLPLP